MEESCPHMSSLKYKQVSCVNLITHFGNTRPLRAVEEKRHLSVVHAVLISLYQSEGQEWRAYSLCRSFFPPHSSRPDDVIPRRVALRRQDLAEREDFRTGSRLEWNLKAKVWQMSPWGVGFAVVSEVVSQNPGTTARCQVGKRQCPLKCLRLTGLAAFAGKAKP